MELILISDNKLKIMLTNDDMKAYSIDCNTLDYENTETRRAFWSILDEAKHRTGFDAASEKVFVQVYPSREGGCEMYITKLGIFSGRRYNGAGSVEDSIRINNGKNTSAVRTGGSNARYPVMQSRSVKNEFGLSRLGAYKFRSLELLLCVCRQLSSVGYSDESSAYKGESGRYYLILREPSKSACALPSSYGFIGEYGEQVDAGFVRTYIGEHGKSICEGSAVQTLGNL